MAKQRPRSYLIRLDPDIYMDEAFSTLGVVTDLAFFDSLFYCARNGGTDFLPQTELDAMVGRDANSVAASLVRLGAWREVALGYEVIGYSGCRVVPEYRVAIPADVRRLVYERDEHTCCDCGSTEFLTLDHIIPWSLGGSDDADNLRTLCRSCNSRKGARV